MTFQRFFSSIITRLVVIGVLIVLAGAFTRYFVLGKYLREELTSVVSAQQLALANYVARDVDYKLTERNAMLIQLAASLPIALLNHPAELRQWLGERHRLQPLFTQGLFVTDTKGRSIADFPQRTEHTQIRYDDRDYVRSALAGEMAIGRPVLGRVVNEPVLPMSAPVKDASGTVRAVLVGVTALDSPGFLSFNQQSRIGENGGFLLISPRDKVFVASSQTDMALKPTPPVGVNLLHDRAMAGYRGTGVTVNAKGIEEISAIASVPSTGWFVVARIPTAEALTTVGRAQRQVAISSALVVIGVILVMTFGLRYVFRPLSRAADQADRMTRGEAPLEPLSVVRLDEVGHLTAAFNRLLSKLQESQSDMSRMAHHDTLTKLPNRALLADRLTQALVRAHRNGTRVGLLYIDLDHFKPINDRMGHEAGDTALVEVSRRLATTVRESDTIARVGGDEFVVLMGELDGSYEQAKIAACAVAAKCLDAVLPPMTLRGMPQQLGASVGIAISDGQMTADELQSAADHAMYEAKHAGGDRFFVAPVPPIYAIPANPAIASA